MTKEEALAFRLMRDETPGLGARKGKNPITLRFLSLQTADGLVPFGQHRLCPLCSGDYGSGVVTLKRTTDCLLTDRSTCDWCGQSFVFSDVDELMKMNSA